jgi:hypothetical protein
MNPNPNQNQKQNIKVPRKQSQRKNVNLNVNVNLQQNQKPKVSPKLKRNMSKNPGSGGAVSFNIRKNKVDKFYCPNLPSTSTKSGPTGSVEIQDLPEIPLDSLFGTP